MATEKSAKPAAESVHEAPKPQGETPKPVVGPDNPEGIDLAKGDKDAALAFEE